MRAREELVAEMGAAYLCAFAGITNTIQNSASYCQGGSKPSRTTANF